MLQRWLTLWPGLWKVLVRAGRGLPTAVRARLLAPPAFPTHVPVVVCRLEAFGSQHTDDLWATSWRNALRTARSALRAFPDDPTVCSHAERVESTYAILFEKPIESVCSDVTGAAGSHPQAGQSFV